MDNPGTSSQKRGFMVIVLLILLYMFKSVNKKIENLFSNMALKLTK